MMGISPIFCRGSYEEEPLFASSIENLRMYVTFIRISASYDPPVVCYIYAVRLALFLGPKYNAYRRNHAERQYART